MRVFVINLEDSVDRKERISMLLSSMKIDFEIFSAVNGRLGLPDDLVNLPDDNHRKIFRSRPLTPGELGCYASHYRLWQKCIELDEPILIMEDDCLPSPYMKVSMQTLSKMHNKGYEYIRVEPQDGKATLLEELDGSQSIFWHNNSSGVRGYSIAPSGAQKLLAKSDRWLCAVDNFIGESYRTGLKCTGIIPYLVLNPGDMGTTIQGGEKLRTPIYFKATREIYRFYRFLRLSFWNLRNSKI